MQTLINLAVRLSGMGWLWDKVDGYKAYGAAAIGILTGLLGLINEIAPILSGHNAGALVALLRGLPTDPSWHLLVVSVLGLGLRHNQDKTAQAQ